MTAQAAYTVMFYVIAAAVVMLALGVTNAAGLLRAAVCLMGVLLGGAGMYVMLGAEFLAGVQVLVYVGGIVVLIVFAIMLTRSAELQTDRPSRRRMVLAAAASMAFLVVTAGVFRMTEFPIFSQAQPQGDNTRQIGQKLLDAGAGGYILPFEIVSLLLLAAVIAGVVISRKTPPPGQPFTSGGDKPGEADFQLPKSQRKPRSRNPNRPERGE